ncbi:MAG: response regulator [Methylobacterium mesophilicum]|nr:response regulator [Methylobacterium mesophilicum]
MPLRVLIVEDQTIVALDVQDIVEGAGFKVVGHATSPEEALKLAAKAKPQIAIVDMSLNGEADGLGVARTLGQRHRIPVLFLTGSDAYIVRANSMEIEPLGYVLKPYQPEDILAPLRAFG